MKYAFWGLVSIVCLGLALGYPSADMLAYALQHPGEPRYNLASIVVGAAFLCPLIGFIWAIRAYTRFLLQFHGRMKTEGLAGLKRSSGGLS